MMRQYHQTYYLNVGVRYYHMIRTIMNMSLSPHEFVVYDGKVFYPTLNVNSDIPEIGKNLVLEDPRHKNIKKHMVRLALYELTKNISPNNVSITRSNDYETSYGLVKGRKQTRRSTP